MTNYKDAKYQFPASGITSGTLANARISEGSVTQHVTETDLQPVKSDISALAVREATNESSAAFNLPNQFIETFSDDTNLGTETDVDRLNGYVASITSVSGNDSYTKCLLKSDGTADDISAVNNTITGSSVTFGSTAITGKFGGNTIKFGQYYSIISLMPHDGEWSRLGGTEQGGRPHTLEVWINRNNMTPTADEMLWTKILSANYQFYLRPTGNLYQTGLQNTGTPSDDYENPSPTNGWHHYCLDYNTTDYKYAFFVDGVKKIEGNSNASNTWPTNNTRAFSFGGDGTGSQQLNAYIDTMRISVGVSRYCPNGVVSSFTPPTTDTYDSGSDSATGTLIQSANTVGSNKTKVGGVAFYKDNEGTATLGSANDLAIYFTCDGGSNWTEAASYNAITPVYSTGVKQVRLGETTCTGGTDVRYKAVWANQSSGSKETQLHGIGINY